MDLKRNSLLPSISASLKTVAEEKTGIKLDDKKSTYGVIGYRINSPK